MRFEVLEPGLFVVTYRATADLMLSQQTELIDALEKALPNGPVAVVFDVGPDVKSVDLSVPGFWLDVTGRLSITAMAIVTTSAAVRIAAQGFRLAQNLRKHPIVVEAHAQVETAIPWARSVVRAKSSKPA